MTSPDPFERVIVLLPARVHQARQQASDALRAELAALIAELPTASSVLAADAPDTDDPEQLKAWVRGVIGALPTRRDGGTHDGDS